MEEKRQKFSLDKLRQKLPIKEVEFVIIDIQSGKILDTTGYAQREFGYSKEEINSPGFWQKVIHPTYHQLFLMCLDYAQYAEACEIWHHTFKITLENGSSGWLKINFKNFSYEDGHKRPKTVAMEMLDITTLVEVEKELKIKVEALDKISKEYSHDVRGPVASILGLIDLLKKEESNSTKELIYEHLYEVVEKLDEVIYKINRQTEK